MIPYTKPTISKRDLEHVLECMVCDSLHEGLNAQRFERRLGELLQTKNILVVDHVSSALFLIFWASGLKKDDEVLLSVAADAAIVEAILFFEARPIFVDLAEERPTMEIDSLRSRLTPKTKVVVCSHTMGHAFAVGGIEWGSRKDDRPIVVEDCMQSLGTELGDGSPLGTKGDYAFYAFGPEGMITMGEGCALRVGQRADHSKIKDHRYAKPRDDKQLRARLQMGITDLQASMGLSELSLFQKFLKRRREIGAHYEDCAARSRCPSFSSLSQGYHYNYAHFAVLPNSPTQTIEALFRRYKVGVKKPFQRLLCDYVLPFEEPRNDAKHFPKARNLQNKVLGVPIYPSLSNKEVEQIGGLLSNIQ